MRRSLPLIASLALLGCDGGDDLPFDKDYAATYTEVRDCRPSGDHNLNNIRVFADPQALASYRERMVSFPVGSVVLKDEFDFADTECAGTPVRWTVMVRLAEGSSPNTLDWTWYDYDGEMNLLSNNMPACIGCHTGCGNPPDGYQGTCAVP
jgi:hypothetical protein